MSLESWAEGIVDSSFFARAVRKSTAKSVVLGWLDAMQNPNAILAELAKGEAPSAPPGQPIAATPASPKQPVALPQPMLLAMPEEKSADEPDRPGVPPRKVRKPQKQAPGNAETQAPPSLLPPDDESTGGQAS